MTTLTVQKISNHLVPQVQDQADAPWSSSAFKSPDFGVHRSATRLGDGAAVSAHEIEQRRPGIDIPSSLGRHAIAFKALKQATEVLSGSLLWDQLESQNLAERTPIASQELGMNLRKAYSMVTALLLMDPVETDRLLTPVNVAALGRLDAEQKSQLSSKFDIMNEDIRYIPNYDKGKAKIEFFAQNIYRAAVICDLTKERQGTLASLRVVGRSGVEFLGQYGGETLLDVTRQLVKVLLARSGASSLSSKMESPGNVAESLIQMATKAQDDHCGKWSYVALNSDTGKIQLLYGERLANALVNLAQQVKKLGSTSVLAFS